MLTAQMESERVASIWGGGVGGGRRGWSREGSVATTPDGYGGGSRRGEAGEAMQDGKLIGGVKCNQIEMGEWVWEKQVGEEVRGGWWWWWW